jgi:hypothetical protein
MPCSFGPRGSVVGMEAHVSFTVGERLLFFDVLALFQDGPAQKRQFLKADPIAPR